MSREVPKGWSESQIDAVADINPDSLRSNTSADYRLKYIDVATVDGPSTMLEPRSMNFGDAPSRARKRVKRGDILVSTVRPYLRSFCQVLSSEPDLVASTAFAVLRPKPPVDGDFLYQHVLWERFVEHLTPRMKGSNYPAVTAGDVGAYPFLLPPLHEQRRIAEILSSVDDAIAATRVVIEQTRKVKQGVLERLLTKGIGHTRFKQTEVGEIPEGWEIKPVEDLCVLSNGNGFRPPDWSDTGLPIIRIQNLNGGENFNYFNGKPLDKWLIHPGDLLFAWAGVRGVSFGPTVWPGPLGVLNQHIFKISCRENVDKLWLFHTMKLITSRIEAKAHGFKDSLLHVQKKEITGQLVAVPPFSEQVKISVRATEVQAAEDAHVSSLKGLLSVKSALMSDLLTGRKRVTGTMPMAAE